MLKGKTIFVTGGAGFIATAAIKRLIADNRIIIWDNFSRNSLQYYPNLKEDRNLTILQGDILDLESLKAAIPPDTDIVIHTAAIAGIDTVTKDPVLTWEVNALGTANLLKALHMLNLIKRLERFVGFSTSEVFGNVALHVEESMPLYMQPVGDNMRWVYAVSKLASEYIIYSYYKSFGLKACILRPFNVFGPGQVGEGAIQRFVKQSLRNEPITIYGDGNQVRSWCYVEDMVEGLLLSLIKEEAIGQVFNIGNPRNAVTMLSLAEKVIRVTNSTSSIVFVPRENTSDVALRIPQIKKAQQLLGYYPKVSLDEGIQMTAAWFRERLSQEAR
jgi:nucleoside-diphosphate-sugar epimerase